MKVVAALLVCSSRSFQRRRRQMFFLSDFWYHFESQTKHVSTCEEDAETRRRDNHYDIHKKSGHRCK